MTANEAKDFIIGRMLDEAGRQGVVLSDVERKMLYFSEVNPPPSVPDYMEVAAAMDAEKPKDPAKYCWRSDEYESEMAALLAAARERDEQLSPENATRWKDAANAIQAEDHYLGVVFMEAGMAADRPPLSATKKVLGSVIALSALTLVILFLIAIFR